MKQFKSISASTFLQHFLATSSCSQSVTQNNSFDYEATTPCNDTVKILLGIPASTKCDMMKDPHGYITIKSCCPAYLSYSIYTFGKAGNKGFMGGEGGLSPFFLPKKELKENAPSERNECKCRAAVYQLTTDDLPVLLFFLKLKWNIFFIY